MARMRRKVEDEDEDEPFYHDTLSNTEIVDKIMSYGNPMKQLVIMTALEKYPQMCINAGASKFESGLLSGEAWIHACREILKELEEYRGQKVRRYHGR